jgi:DNA polymerase-1
MTKKNNYSDVFDPQKTIYLIDGSSFLYRAYYGLRPLHTPQGVPVQAVFSFCRMIKHLIDQFNPNFMILVWDSRGKTLRHEIYPAYKATRQAPPSDLFEQKQLIMKFADLIGLYQIIKDGVEADDLMYSAAKELAGPDYHAVIVSSDKDMAQTLNEYISIYDPFKDQIITASSYEQLVGFQLRKLPFYYALLGDTSDNIPGVKGIGKKGAADLVKQYQSLEDVYEHIESVKPERTRKALQEYKENAFLSEELFELRYVPTGTSKTDIIFDQSKWSEAQAFFQELNFKSLLKKEEVEAHQSQQLAITDGEQAVDPFTRLKEYEFKTVVTTAELEAVVAKIYIAGVVAVDTETDGLMPLYNSCVGLSLCVQKGIAYYIPCGHKTGEQQLSCNEIVRILKPMFEDPTIKKYLHNAKFDQLVLHAIGIEMAGMAFDSYIVARLLLREWQRAGLKPLSEFYFNEVMLNFNEVLNYCKVKDFSQVPLTLATRYAAADAHQTYQLAQLLKIELAKDPVIEKLYENIEHPLIQVLVDMEAEGIELDVPLLKQLGDTVKGSLEAVECAIKNMVNMPDINLNSPRQVEDLLFTKLALPPQKKSAKGTGYSTDQEVLNTLSKMHPVPGLIMQYRELAKLKNTYIDALPTYVNPKTGRIHTTFSQTSTATGRLSSMEPNLQNVPTDGTGYGLAIRGAFKPKKGHLFIAVDYSQIELRVLAYLSQDQNLMSAFAYDHDIHAETAARIFQVPLMAVTHEQRQVGKKINFSILYGLTPYGLSKDLGIGQKEAKSYIDSYFAQYPEVSVWMAEVIREVMTDGYVATLFGRKRYIPTIFEKNRVLHEEAKRMAINTKAQGTAADVMKLGMIDIANEFKAQQLDAAIVLQIHDEILVTAAHDIVEQVGTLVTQKLESVVKWNVPLKVTARIGSSWKDVTK